MEALSDLHYKDDYPAIEEPFTPSVGEGLDNWQLNEVFHNLDLPDMERATATFEVSLSH